MINVHNSVWTRFIYMADFPVYQYSIDLHLSDVEVMVDARVGSLVKDQLKEDLS